MDRAEAIRVLTVERSSHSDGGLVEQAIDVALAALREQEDLENRLNENIGAAKMWCRRYHELARNSHDVATACEWINVEDALPGTERVLITNGEVVKEGYRRPDGVWKYGKEEHMRWERLSCHPVTHWMLLPEPPKD